MTDRQAKAVSLVIVAKWELVAKWEPKRLAVPSELVGLLSDLNNLIFSSVGIPNQFLDIRPPCHEREHTLQDRADALLGAAFTLSDRVEPQG